MITARILPYPEWHKVADRPPFDRFGLPAEDVAAHWEIIVVEDDGQIVACCSLSDQVHWDGFSVNPSHQGNPAVFRQLLAFSLQQLQAAGVIGAHLTVPHGQPVLSDMVERFGFVKAPGDLYVINTMPDDGINTRPPDREDQ